MNPKAIAKNILKSTSAIALGLFFMVHFSELKAQVLFDFVGDTIIIDGKTVEIEREIVYEDSTQTVAIPEPPKEGSDKKKRKNLRWFIAGGVQANFTLGKLNSNASNLTTTSEFLNNTDSGAGGFGGRLQLGIKLSDNFWVATGLDYKSSKVQFSTFDAGQLSDSLAYFSNQNGLLYGVNINRSPLGTEKDSALVNIERRQFDLNYIEIPISFFYNWQFKRSPWQPYLGASFAVKFAQKPNAQEIILFNATTAKVEQYELSENQIASPIFGAQFSIGTRYLLNKQLSIFGALSYHYTFSDPLTIEVLSFAPQDARLTAGVLISFGD